MCGVWKVPSAALAKTACIIGALTLSSFAWPQTVQDATSACPGGSTKLPLMTYDEPVQYLANSTCRTSFLDRIQFIPLRQDNDNYYLSFGFWIRERGEYASNPNFSSTPSGNA
jgi:hypothetical protein